MKGSVSEQGCAEYSRSLFGTCHVTMQRWLHFLIFDFDLDPLSWKDETFGYTIPEEGKDHAKSTKDLHSGV